MRHPATYARSHAQPTHVHAQPLHSYLARMGPQSQGALCCVEASGRPMLDQHYMVLDLTMQQREHTICSAPSSTAGQ